MQGWIFGSQLEPHHNHAKWLFLTTDCPVAQWLEHLTRLRRVMGSNNIWDSDFFPRSPFIYHHVTVVSSLIVHSCCTGHLVTRGTTSQRLGSISFSFFFFLHVAISDSVQWLPYLGFVPGPTRTTSKCLMSLLLGKDKVSVNILGYG